MRTLPLLCLPLTACTPDSAEPLPRDQWPDLSEDTGDPSGADSDDGDSGVDPGDSGEDTDEPTNGSGGSGGPTGTGTASVGSVTYAYHVPSCALTSPAPVLFTQHGQGGTGASMVSQWQALADAECFIVIGQGSQSGNGWNFNSDVEGLGALVDEVDSLWDVDTDRRVLHGYSAGAHWSYVVGLANSDVFGGLVVYAGAMSYAESYDVWPNGTKGPIPVAIGHGTDDTVVSYGFAQQAEAELSGAGWPVELWSAAGGSHAYDPAHQAPAWAFVMDSLD
ncbi:MAG: hypothetical protein GY913_19065 [Proteobacteria bacterium]|nr:hypothetical protein [Pseudomonadota bacterium]MCP4919010.1 hypothetical protein [Pseudomonadota bacterium]